MSNSTRCPACGAENLSSARFCSGCGANLNSEASPYQSPAASQPINPGHGNALVSEFIYAGFWKRLVARIIDSIIFGFGFWALILLFSLKVSPQAGGNMSDKDVMNAVILFYLIYFGGWWLYNAIMESSNMQATLGKKALGIKVTDDMGYPISFWRASGRHFSAIVSSMIFSIGYLMAAFSSKKQALHDMIAGCLVINNNFDSVQVQTAAHSPRKTMSGAAIAGIVAMIVAVPVIGILAAIALPAYQDYTIRAKVSSAIDSTEFVQQQIIQYAETNGSWPDNLAKAGVSQRHLDNDGYDIILANDGRYQLRFSKPTLIQTKSVIFTPQLVSGGHYQWHCASESLADKYLPQKCRGGQPIQ